MAIRRSGTLRLNKDVILSYSDNDPLYERITFRRAYPWSALLQAKREDEISSTDVESDLADEEVTLLVNPKNISISRRKVFSKQMTNNRWVYQHWGFEPIVLKYSGVTGFINIQRPSSLANSHKQGNEETEGDPSGAWRRERALSGFEYISPYETPQYKALLALKRFYDTPNLLELDPVTDTSERISRTVSQLAIEMEFRSEVFLGYFASFEIQEHEDNPWLWSYSMEFQATDVVKDYSDIYDGVSSLSWRRGLDDLSDDPLAAALAKEAANNRVSTVTEITEEELAELTSRA